MSVLKKNRLLSETAFLEAITQGLRPFLSERNYREARACGISGAQLYAVLRGEPVNFTVLTLLRLANAKGETLSSLITSAERVTARQPSIKAPK